MASFSGCRVTIDYGDARGVVEDEDADLQVEGDRLLLSYWDERGVVVLIGAESAPGRWELHARSRPRRCSLAREGARTFTGSWVEGDESGSLRVEIPAAPAARTEEPQ